MRAAGFRVCRVETHDASCISESFALQQLISEIRTSGFRDGSTPLDGKLYFSYKKLKLFKSSLPAAGNDATSRHAIGYIGDIPISVGRWSCIQCINGMTFAVIDKLTVLDNYRMRGMGELTLRRLLDDIEQARSLTPLAGVRIKITPPCTFIVDKMAAVGFAAVSNGILGAPCDHGDVWIEKILT